LGWADSDSEVEGELKDAGVDEGACVTTVQKSNLNCKSSRAQVVIDAFQSWRSLL
jgi:hypothetical protein